jgi:murein L,D-transpeptidase YafK
MLKPILKPALAVMLAFIVSACLTHRSLEPLPANTRTDLESRGFKVGAPLYIRAFKQENELEVWLRRDNGDYDLFRTYAICNWSGVLGPKIKEGDKQAPEGFYVVNASQMNPNSKHYLSFNLGYPNAYDKAHGRTGRHLMVHGGCSSAGCYAITDEAVKEVFILAREAFSDGQREFPVHAFPFRMTAENLALHAGHRWHGFWKNLKQGYDMFEVTRRPPMVGHSAGQYVFAPDGAQMNIIATASVEPIKGW